MLDVWDAGELFNAPVGVENQVGWDGDIQSDDGGNDNRGGSDVVMGGANDGGGCGNNTPVPNGTGKLAAAPTPTE